MRFRCLALALALICISGSANSTPLATEHTVSVRAGGSSTGETRVIIELEIGTETSTTVAGLHVVRRVLGECGTPQALTSTPLTWPGPGTYDFEVMDTIVEGTIHVFDLVAIDASGQPTDFEEFAEASIRTYSHFGSQLVAGRGRFVSVGSSTLFVPCPDSCWDLLRVQRTPLVDANTDTGKDLEVTGNVNCWPVGTGCEMLAFSVEPFSCTTVATEQPTWGSVKARF